jgi:hypothetical protein
LVYQYRDQLPGKLAARFRTMPGPPDELVIIGRAAGLHKRTAQGIVRMVERWFPAAIRRTKPYGPRAVGMVEAGRLTVWPSCAAAARHFHTRRQGIFAMVEAGRLFWAN